MNNSQKLFPHH